MVLNVSESESQNSNIRIELTRHYVPLHADRGTLNLLLDEIRYIFRNRGRVRALPNSGAHLLRLVDLLQEVFRRLKMRQIRNNATLEERSSLDEQRDVAIVHLLGLVETTLLGGPQECLSKV